MSDEFDLKLIQVLDALVTEKSVSKAAQKLNFSVSAMSRFLSRLRNEFNDPILVRAGLEFVPTARAVELRDQLNPLLLSIRRLTRASDEFDPVTTHRDFVITMSEAVFTFFSRALVAHLRVVAPNVHCAFLIEGRELALREPLIDLAIGAIHTHEPEIRLEPILTDRLVGVCCVDHPLVTEGVTMERYVSAEHILNSRRGSLSFFHDAELGIERTVVASAPIGISLWIIPGSDLVGLCYERLSGSLVRSLGLTTFELPFRRQPDLIHQAWHPRYDNDPAHLWLRQTIRTVIKAEFEGCTNETGRPLEAEGKCAVTKVDS